MVRFFKHKLEGGALYVAVILAVVTGVIVSLLLLLARYNQNSVTRHVQSVQLGLDIKSGLEMAKSAYFTESYNNKWLKSSFGNDSFKINKKPWGAYVLLQVTSSGRSGRMFKSGLYGTFAFADTGLVVSESQRPVSLSGKIIFKGACYLPSAGVKAAYINGLAYQPDAGNERFIKKTTVLPAVSPVFLKNIRAQTEPVNDETDSVIHSLPLVLHQSYNCKTVVVEVSPGRMGNMALSNNIKISCNGELIVDSTCHLENIVITAKKVKFKSGFKGSVNVICSDSISAGERCEFTYPSSLVLLPFGKDLPLSPSVALKEDCTLWGSIVALGNGNEKIKPFVKLDKGNVINGLVYSSGYVHVEGTINGTIVSDKLLLKTPSAVYENYISGCEIDPQKYAGELVVPMLFSTSNKLICCENL